jgi:hypothetical protein
MSFLLLLTSSVQQNWRRGQNRICLEEKRVGERRRDRRQEGEMAQTMYAHMNKWINKPKKET